MRGGLFVWGMLVAARAAAQGSGAIAGSVFDSLRARPLAAATVVLEGTPFATRTDSAGRFAIDSVPAGAYVVSVESESLDSLGVAVAAARATIAAGSRAELALGSPSRRTLTAMVCGGSLADDAGVLIGVVRDAAGGKAAEGATVRVEWTSLSAQGGAVVAQRALVTSPVSDRGLYRACGVPAGGTVQVRATGGARASGVVELPIAIYGFARRDLLVGGDSGGIVRGAVLDSARAPLAGARVSLAGDSAFAMSDDRGAFTLTAALTGTRELEVRRVGYAPWRGAVDIRSGAPTMLTVVMSKPPTVLATVNVRGAPAATESGAQGFAARKARGNGRFIDRRAIESRGDIEALELLRGTPGIQLSTARGVTVATWTRSSTGCRPAYFLDGLVTDSRALPRASDIEGIEIYSPSEVPPQYAGASMRCAVVLFWTRRSAGSEPAARAPPDSGMSR